MGLLQNAFGFAGVMFAIFYEQSLILYFLAFIGMYAVCHFMTPARNMNNLRRKLMFATWERPAEGNIYIKLEKDCTNFIKYQEKFAKEDRPTITHLVTKALGECLNSSKDTLNGKIIFDRFVPFSRVAISVLVDINGGKDLAAVTVENVDKMSIKDLQSFIKSKGIKAKGNKDEDHKKRMDGIKLMPPFIIRIMLQVGQWLAFNLGLDIPPMAVKKDSFGAGCVTSVGMLGVKDAIVPFTPLMNCSVIVAVGQIQEKAVVKDGKIEIAPIVTLNFTVDHRFVDGAKGKALLKDLDDVFDNPEKY